MKRRIVIVTSLIGLALLLSCGSGVSSGDDLSTDPGPADLDAGPDGQVKPDGLIPDVPLPDGLDVPRPDADGATDDPSGPDGDDAGPDGADATPECLPPYAGFGCACTSDDDCASGYCVETHAGRACSTPCTDSCDAPGWTCAEVKNTCPDCVYICVFQALTLCRPCLSDDDCASADVSLDARCVPYGPAGSFCGAPCGADPSCPAGYACEEIPLPGGATSSQCVLQQGLCPCSPKAIAEAASTACHVQNEHGQCPGFRACTESGLGACDGPTPEAEACNGHDDDCDGLTDEGIAPQPCAITNETGSCPGEKTCEDGAWTCTGPTPAAETCNGKDDDCDGLTDNAYGDLDADGQADCVDPDDDGDGVPDDGNQSGTIGDAPCTGDQSRRGGGVIGCDDNCTQVANPGQGDLDKDGKGDGCDCDADGDNYLSTAPGCNGDDCFDLDKSRNPGLVEAPIAGDACRWCNAIDDNCDGLTDEGCPDADTDGQADCVDADDDNDGVPDAVDNCPLLQNQGQQDRDADGLGDACDPDADGDGVADDVDNCPFTANPDQADADGDGDGDACDGDRDGDGDPDTTDCAPDDPTGHHGAAEVCNGRDDDCDGLTDADDLPDDGCEGAGCNQPLRVVPCDRQEGLCAGCLKGPEHCRYGEWLPCSGADYTFCDEGYEYEETWCDGQDNDCDGTTDEGHAFPDWDGRDVPLGGACGTGACAGGTVVCHPEMWTTLCTSSNARSPEVCNALDDDCDGKTDAQDADLPAHDAPLCEKQAGVCSDSRKAPSLCVGGFWLVCGELDYAAHATAYQHGAETTCDGLDNDCDTQRDEGFTFTDWNGQLVKLGDPCGTGACAGGAVHCVDAATAGCSTAASATSEACNGLDDDCDGRADEGFTFTDWNGQVRALHAGCGTGACAGGAVVCDASGDGTVCDTAANAAPEACNNLDDDCDGKLDANDPDLLANDHPACENTQGVCAGCAKPSSRCVGGTWLPCGDLDYAACSTWYQAGSELTCDGLDNNCSGATDEAFVLADWNGQVRGLGQACGTGACLGGTVVCNATGNGAACSSSGLAAFEACNGADDDCDGTADEGFAIVDWNGQARTVGLSCGTGACAGGVVVCDAPNNRAVCSSAPSASAEGCDGVDNDCDGTIDEGFSLVDWNGQTRALGAACGTGACANGTVVCNAAHDGATCDTAGNAGAETCNGADDDCDGKVDAADPNLLTFDHPACELQAGVCFGCTKPASLCAGGTWLPCDATRYLACNPLYQAGAEASCDLLDNDCNGQVDEDFANDVDNCGGCGKRCTNDHGSTLCNNGVCKPDCSGGYKSCDGNVMNGCETYARTNEHCGDCNVSCSLDHANETCSTGVCEISSCDVGYCNYDGLGGTGCEYDLDTDPGCSVFTDLGSVSGDTSPASNAVQATGRGERWARVYVDELEESLSVTRLSATVTLTPAAGTDYDLGVYCDNCTTSAGSSINGAGQVEVVNVRWEEDSYCVLGICTPSGSDSGRYLYIRVAHYEARTCNEWTLRVQGNTSVSTATCSKK